MRKGKNGLNPRPISLLRGVYVKVLAVLFISTILMGSACTDEIHAFDKFDLFHWTKVQFLNKSLNILSEHYHIEECDVQKCPKVVAADNEEDWKAIIKVMLGEDKSDEWVERKADKLLGFFVYTHPNFVFVYDSSEVELLEGYIVHEMTHYLQYHCSYLYKNRMKCTTTTCFYNSDMQLEMEAYAMQRKFLNTFYGIIDPNSLFVELSTECVKTKEIQ